jgi:hypothetical protein
MNRARGKILHDTLDSTQRDRLNRDLAAELNRARVERVAAIRHRAAGDKDAEAAALAAAMDATEHADRIRSVLVRFPARKPLGRVA